MFRSDFTPVRNGLHQLLRTDASMDATFLVRIIFSKKLVYGGMQSETENEMNFKLSISSDV